ncbi:pectin acetylesterase-family hydrolase [Pseudomonadota bacterium]
MKKSNLISALLVITASLTLTTPPANAETPWQRITATPGTTLVNNAERTYAPGCALPNPDLSPNEYSFYFKQGKSDKLIVYFNGGGACWNTATCLASLNMPGALPAYVPTDEAPHNDPNLRQGIFDFQHPDNFYADWSILFLPYCTGDVHFGSNDVDYGAPFPVRHRGFDNFLAAREWLKSHYANTAPKKLLVAGSSAGAYGAALNYAHLKETFPISKGYLFADGGNGVITDEFIHTAIIDAWGISQNLASLVPNMAGITDLDATTFLPAIYSALTSHYDKDKFSQYTTIFDLIQATFLNIMLNANDPTKWADPSELGPLFPQWTGTMMYFSHLLANADNYRYYIASGCEHTILRNNDMHNAAVTDISVSTWLNGMTRGKKHAQNWQNLNCTFEGCATEEAFASLDFHSCMSIPQNQGSPE